MRDGAAHLEHASRSFQTVLGHAPSSLISRRVTSLTNLFRESPGPHMVHSHTVRLPPGALLIPRTMCGTGESDLRQLGDVVAEAMRPVPHSVHPHTVHLPLGALLSPCTMWYR